MKEISALVARDVCEFSLLEEWSIIANVYVTIQQQQFAAEEMKGSEEGAGRQSEKYPIVVALLSSGRMMTVPALFRGGKEGRQWRGGLKGATIRRRVVGAREEAMMRQQKE